MNDLDHAPTLLLHYEQFNSISEYSWTLPTATTIGKFWRTETKDGTWFVGCYAEDGDPTKVRILWHEVVLLEGPPSPEWQAPDWSNYERWKAERQLDRAEARAGFG